MSYRTPISKARGLGSARSGTEHAMWTKITALLMIPLVIWFVIFVIKLTRYNIAEIHATIMSPISLIGVISVVVIALWHSILGMKMIIEDYVSCINTRMMLITCVYFIALLSLIAMLVAALHMHNVVSIIALLDT